MNENSDAKVRASPPSSSPAFKSMSFRQDSSLHRQPSQLLVPLDDFGPMNTVIIDGRTYGVYESTAHIISPNNSSTTSSSQSSPIQPSPIQSSPIQSTPLQASPLQSIPSLDGVTLSSDRITPSSDRMTSSSNGMTSSSDRIALQQVLKPPPPYLSNGVVKRSSSGMGTKPMHTCSVCGDRAFYVFYGALACDSCRTFFRRQVLQSKTLVCHFKGSCQVQLSTRKDCAKCRLEKCVRVGMKSSLVAVNEPADSVCNETEADSSSERTQTIISDSVMFEKDLNMNRPRRCGSFSSRSTPSSPSSRKPMKQEPSTEISVTLFRSLSGQEINSSVQETNNSFPPSKPDMYKSKKHLALLKDLDSSKSPDQMKPKSTNLDSMPPVTPSSVPSSLFPSSLVPPSSVPPSLVPSSFRPSLVARKTHSKATSFPVKVVSPKDGSVREVNFMNLHLIEQEKVAELLEAAKKLEMKGESCDGSEKAPFNLCNVIYLATSRLVAAIESLKSFNFLPHSDQLVLLKGSISEMIFLWSVRAFDPDSNSWILSCFRNKISSSNDLRLPMEVLKAAKHDLSLYQEYEKFVANFDPNLGKDHLLINILIAICLFNPDRDGLIEKEHVRYERNLYRSLLQKYLESVAEKEESAAIFSWLTHKIEDLSTLKDIYESSEVDPDDINQLVRTTKLLVIKNVM